jgi:hypothetical protein
MGRNTVQEYPERAQQMGLKWPLDPELDEATLGVSNYIYAEATLFQDLPPPRFNPMSMPLSSLEAPRNSS